MKSCQRCKQTFVEEGLDTEVQAEKLIHFLRNTHWTNLCRNCLQEFEALLTMAEQTAFHAGSSTLDEGIHYYVEDGLFVFTELYHLLKGYCCKNRCRHCAYGYKRPI